MIIQVGPELVPKYEVSFGTHNNKFHTDELLAIAILEMAFINRKTCVVRTRDHSLLSGLDYIVDIGGGEYDHHMKGFNRRRPTGEIYASAGLVWKDFGESAIKKVLTHSKLCQIEMSQEILNEIVEEIDREIIIPVDLEDNGIPVNLHTFSFVSSFLPVWFKKNPNYDKAFWEAEKIAVSILYHLIVDKVVKKVTTYDLLNTIENMVQKEDSLVKNGILEIPSQLMPWEDGLILFNGKNSEKIKFVIFPYPAGGWAAQCVPPSKDEMFSQICPFPKEWKGGDSRSLPRITGIPDAIFCHNGRFFARAGSKESIIKMCYLAQNNH